MNTHEGYSKKKLSNDNVLLAGGGEKSLADFLGGIRISSSKIQYKAADSAASWTDLITLVNTDENVKQVDNNNNQNSPILLKNGTGTGTITSSSIFADGVTINPKNNALSVSGYIDGKILISGGSYNWYSFQQYNSSDANPTWYDLRSAIININSYSGWLPWIRGVDSEKGSWCIGQYTTNFHVAYIAKANTNNTTTKRWDFGKDGKLTSPGGFVHGGLTPPTGVSKDAYVLLAGGGYKEVSDFATSTHNHDGRYSYAHQSDWAYNVAHNSDYVTFDKSNGAGAPSTSWYNGFVSTHSNYLSSYIVNEHRTANWYVGYSKNTTAPTWYKLLHTGNSSVSKSGETLTVNIGGTSYSLTNTWRGITDTYYATSPSSDTSLSQKGSSNMFDLLTKSGGRWSWGGSGKNQYCLIAEIDTSGGYINYPIIFELNGRSLDYTKLSILFVNLSSADPALSYFHTDNVTSFYLYKSAASKWLLYGSAPDGVWAIINLVRVIGSLASSVTVKMESAASLPTGYTLPTYGWNVNYASSAGSVAWDNVTSKPLSATSGNNGPTWGNFVPVKSDGVMEIGKYLDFHNSSNDGVDYAVRLMCLGNNQVIVNLPTSAGTLALTSQIPTVNNASLTLQTAGTTLTTFYANDSTNRTFNVTCANIGAAPAHDHPYVRTYSGTDVNPSTTYGYWHAMTTLSGISSDWWHVIHMDWSGAANWRSELALPTLHRTGVYYRSDNWSWSSWICLLDTSSTNQTKSGTLTAAHFYEPSDIRLKHDISMISKSVRKFRFNNDNKLYYGFIAQELEVIHPELVDNSEEYKKVNYNSAICYYIAELENKVLKLEEKLQKLENIN